ncbi:MAG: hypothetical protein R2800_00195 [Flavipsychrobacter sp.]
MSSTRIQDDLLKEFNETKKMIYEQVELLDPLATSLRKPAAQRLINKGALAFTEIVLYLLFAGTILFAFFMNKIYPFYILTEMKYKPEYRPLGIEKIEFLNITIYAVVGIIALLFYALARTVRHIRLKNNILNLAGKNIKHIVGQHLERKAVIDAIVQRHFLELPNTHLEEGVVTSANEVANPGYDEA